MDPQNHEKHNGHDLVKQGHEEHTHAHAPAAHEHDTAQAAAQHDEHVDHSGHEQLGEHTDHVDHSGHEQIFRQRFWISTLLSIPVVLFSEIIQGWFGFSMPTFPGSDWIPAVFSAVVFFYGGVPFLEMAVPEVRKRQPGMMLLISLAISVSFVYSLAAFFFGLGEVFYWELVTLIDIMLLGHWIEMRSVRQASGSLAELAKLMPDE
ncbi:MAG TPA: hypothetical protein VIH14_04680, partial [Anaerolineales bacterium]